MLPFYAAAICIVVIAGSVIAWNVHRVRTDIRIRSGPAHGSPTRFAPRREPTGAPEAISMRATWVLSALPDCAIQRWERRGPESSPLVRTPASARVYPDGSEVNAGPCRITVSGRRLIIARGSDRFEVPPDARLYAYGGGLLVRHDAAGHAELRAYRVQLR